MNDNVTVIRSYSHGEMMDIVGLMFANSEFDFIDIQVRMSYITRELKTDVVVLHHPNSEHPIAISNNFGFGFVMTFMRTLYERANTSEAFINSVNMIVRPCRTSYIQREIS